MFTGIIEHLGSVTAVHDTPGAGAGSRLLIDAGTTIAGAATVGDSIAVNGTCLTVVDVDATAGRLAFDVIGQTLRHTNLGALSSGSRVNLERPLAVGDHLHGHFVMGHVDDVATVEARDERPDEVRVRLALPAAMTALCIPRGSIALDGVSLTIAELTETAVTVALIPHTLAVTTFGSRRVGDTVNVEIDMLGKHVARLLGRLPSGLDPAAPDQPGATGGQSITEERLRDLGY